MVTMVLNLVSVEIHPPFLAKVWFYAFNRFKFSQLPWWWWLAGAQLLDGANISTLIYSSPAW